MICHKGINVNDIEESLRYILIELYYKNKYKQK